MPPLRPSRRFAALGLALALTVAAMCLAACGSGDGNQAGTGREAPAQLERGSSKSHQQGSATFRALAASIPGQVGVTYGPVGRGGQITSLGDLRTGAAWSTIKLVLAAKTLLDAGGPGKLTSAQRSQISAALRRSDNAAAMALWSALVSRYGGASGAARELGSLLRDAGDKTTKISTVGRDGFSPYGQTEWSLVNQTRFTAALAGGCLADREITAFLLNEMSNVIPGQRWGLGSTSVSADLKGGWGPGRDGKYIVRQTGVLDFGADRRVVVSIATIPRDGQFGSGVKILDKVADWAAGHLPGSPGRGC